MERLSIPTKYRDGIKVLLLLEPDEADAIRSVLETTADPSSDTAVKSVADVISFDVSPVRDALQALKALYAVRANSDVELPTFVQDVLKASTDFINPIDPGKWAQAESSLFKLLDIPKLRQRSRKISAVLTGERTFCKAMVSTDIRPITTGEPGTDPDTAILVHNLRMRFHDDKGKHRSFYVSLDSSDLRRLKQEISKAEEAEKKLFNYLKMFARDGKEI